MSKYDQAYILEVFYHAECSKHITAIKKNKNISIRKLVGNFIKTLITETLKYVTK